jgi:hypothetical protein
MQHFERERAQLDLRFTCEDCALHDVAKDVCAHGWPGGAPGGVHRLATYQATLTPVFCKEFELR